MFNIFHLEVVSCQLTALYWQLIGLKLKATNQSDPQAVKSRRSHSVVVSYQWDTGLASWHISHGPVVTVCWWLDQPTADPVSGTPTPPAFRLTNTFRSRRTPIPRCRFWRKGASRLLQLTGDQHNMWRDKNMRGFHPVRKNLQQKNASKYSWTCLTERGNAYRRNPDGGVEARPDMLSWLFKELNEKYKCRKGCIDLEWGQELQFYQYYSQLSKAFTILI